MTDTTTSLAQTAADNERLGQLRQHYHGRFRLSFVSVIALAVLFGVVKPRSVPPRVVDGDGHHTLPHQLALPGPDHMDVALGTPTLE